MKTTDERVRFIPQHKKGHFVDLHSQPVEDFMKAVRFTREDDLEVWILGRYGPEDPQNFRTVTVKVTYELEGIEHERFESISKNCGGSQDS